MATSRSLRLRRRSLLGVPALAAAAVTVVVLKPGTAAAAVPIECVADLLLAQET